MDENRQVLRGEFEEFNAILCRQSLMKDRTRTRKCAAYSSLMRYTNAVFASVTESYKTSLNLIVGYYFRSCAVGVVRRRVVEIEMRRPRIR